MGMSETKKRPAENPAGRFVFAAYFKSMSFLRRQESIQELDSGSSPE